MNSNDDKAGFSSQVTGTRILAYFENDPYIVYMRQNTISNSRYLSGLKFVFRFPYVLLSLMHERNNKED